MVKVDVGSKVGMVIEFLLRRDVYFVFDRFIRESFFGDFVYFLNDRCCLRFDNF